MASSVAPNYASAKTISARLEAAYPYRHITPQWIKSLDTTDGSSECIQDRFWYRHKALEPKQYYTFTLVDAKQGTANPAFDHAKLAEALRKKGIDCKSAESDDTSPDTSQTTVPVPIRWIDISESTPESATVRFRLHGQKYQFTANAGDPGTLSEFDGEIDEEHLKPLDEEIPSNSDKADEAVSICFVNQTEHELSLYWIDFDGKPKFYKHVNERSEQTMSTYVGHVWRVTRANPANGDEEKVTGDGTGVPIASFVSWTRETRAIITSKMEGETKILEENKTKIKEGEDAEQIQPPVEPTDADPNPSQDVQDGKPEFFVKDHNLWARQSNGQELQLSNTGTEEQPFDESKIYPSSNGRHVIAWQYTPAQKRILYHIESSPKDQLQPRLKNMHYLKPGDRVRVDRPRLFDLESKQEHEVSTESGLFEDPYRLSEIGWNADGSEYRFLFNQRGHQVLRIVGIDLDGKVKNLVEEKSPTFIDYSSKEYHYHLKETDELIWASERSNWNHMYLYDLKTGSLKNEITKGEWVVKSVDRIDVGKRQIWLSVMGVIKDQDPYHVHCARVNFDGSGFTILTDGDGTHEWTWSPDFELKYLLDTFSRVDCPKQTILREGATGKPILRLDAGATPIDEALDRLEKAGWTPPERFAAPGRDNTTLIHGIIIRPSPATFDPAKKYPVLEEIYAGPTDFNVPKWFPLLAKQREVAELGFILVMIDGMGTNWRDKKFHDVCYKNLRDAGFPDRIAWMRAAAESRPWMDISSGVGIYGGSAGGQNALAALLWHGDFYTAAAADCGCHDNRLDKIWWNEQWLGTPVPVGNIPGNADAYTENSNVVHAHRLKGRLLLMMGELDDNVDPASTLQVVHALNKARKDYELVFIPGGGHGVSHLSDSYAQRRMRDFFVKHLKGVEPPNRNLEHDE